MMNYDEMNYAAVQEEIEVNGTEDIAAEAELAEAEAEAETEEASEEEELTEEAGSEAEAEEAETEESEAEAEEAEAEESETETDEAGEEESEAEAEEAEAEESETEAEGASEEEELTEAVVEAIMAEAGAEETADAEPDAEKKEKKNSKKKAKKKTGKKVTEKAIERAVALVEKKAVKEAGSKKEKKAIRKALAKAEKKAMKAAVKETLMEEAAAIAEQKIMKEAAVLVEQEALMGAVAAVGEEAVMEAAANMDQGALIDAAKTAAVEADAKAEMKEEKKAEKKKRSKPDPVKAEIKKLRSRLTALQQTVRDQGIPIIVLVEGWAAAGKGSLINELISEIDPRNYNVFSPVITPEALSRYPFLYPYANAIPENGKIMFYDSGWMEDCVSKVLCRDITRNEYKNRLRAVTEFERQLRDGGYLVLKLFLNISEAEQRERIFSLRENYETEWRVTPDDMWQLQEHRTFWQNYKIFMEKTNDPIPWHVLDGSNRAVATRDALALLLEQIDTALKKGRYVGKPFKEKFPLLAMPKLSDVDLTPALSDEEYKKELKKLQKRLGELHNILYRKKIPVILCYEGWDAAGKGGNIRRVARPLDPRGCDVIPIASPEPHELNRQYLWRFWTRLPRTGHVCIFDRTWYGRVMVERLEGFCSEDDWKRAYNEINEFERQLTDWGAVVIKFWIHIDQDTQLERFTARQNTPEKAWKLTEEDWRNREKWAEYEEAIDEMLQKTSTENAPWVIIESNDKKFARIKALRIVVDALEKACAERLA